ncbi:MULTISPECIES: ABC transporter ATP-binding protein [Amycolatopsis]|uniref:ABC transporter ATP-binding protein n=1 Tax=Amycolatopsis TaxID=1813 RepID=UPI00106FAD70|nr:MULTISPECIES: ABC transporter ATP-binding protein [Amycolatopsis]
MTSESGKAVEVTGLTKVYRAGSGTRRVVDGLHLAIEHGQVLGLLGVNGAGKTTTIKMICGLVTPTSGELRVNGCDVRRSRRRAMAQIGAVLEGTRNIYWQLSAWENLRYFARLKGSRGTAWRERAEQLLRDLELWERRHEPVTRFSRGMQQKVAIACALIGDPPVILLDEPTLGLDAQASRTVRLWVDRLAREEGRTVLLTSHQLEVVQDLCDRVAVIHQGRMLIDKPVKELLALFGKDSYEIRLGGHLDAREPAWRDLEVTARDGEITLSGEINDQEELHELLAHARSRSLTVLGINRLEPTLEEVFLRVVQDEQELRR